jgi:hypothetical protein
MIHEYATEATDTDELQLRPLDLDEKAGYFAYRELGRMLGRAASYGLMEQSVMIAADQQDRVMVMTYDSFARRVEGNRILPAERRLVSRFEIGPHAYVLRAEFDEVTGEYEVTYANTDDEVLFEGEDDLDVLDAHLKTADEILSGAIGKRMTSNVVQLDTHRLPPNR